MAEETKAPKPAKVPKTFDELYAAEIAYKVSCGLRPEQAVEVIKRQIAFDAEQAEKAAATKAPADSAAK